MGLIPTAEGAYMGIDRRTFIGASTLALGTAGADALPATDAATPAPARPKWRRIAVEEAFSIPEQMDLFRGLLKTASYDPDLYLAQFQVARDPVRGRLLDLEGERLQIMDKNDVAMHVLSLTSTGVQAFDADTGTRLASLANDRLAEVVARHPGRFAGLASFAPQDPARAVQEIDRAITRLRLSGLIVNSHTNGEYLSERRYWPILEAIAGLEVPLYIHPRAPTPAMAAPYRPDHLEHGIFGYQAETGLHALRMIMSGVFDQFPKLRIILGHMGEGLPFWLYRIDNSFRRTLRFMERTKLKQVPGDYFRQNFLVTTSGVNWHPPLGFCIDVLGADNVMWAIDYPYEETEVAVEFMDTAPIPDTVKAAVYHGNAERVFRIAPI
jgi:5-carboxyvanillate decarboxylase